MQLPYNRGDDLAESYPDRKTSRSCDTRLRIRRRGGVWARCRRAAWSAARPAWRPVGGICGSRPPPAPAPARPAALLHPAARPPAAAPPAEPAQRHDSTCLPFTVNSVCEAGIPGCIQATRIGVRQPSLQAARSTIVGVHQRLDTSQRRAGRRVPSGCRLAAARAHAANDSASSPPSPSRSARSSPSSALASL